MVERLSLSTKSPPIKIMNRTISIQVPNFPLSCSRYFSSPFADSSMLRPLLSFGLLTVEYSFGRLG